MSTNALIVAPSVSDDDRLIELWLKGNKRASVHTQRAYRSDVDAFRQATGVKPLQAVSVADLEMYAASLSERGLSPATQRRMIASVRSLLSYALKVGYCHVNAGAAVDMARPRDDLSKRLLTEGDVTRLIALEPDRAKRAILHLAYILAARVSELCSLRWGDIRETEAGYVFRIVGKGNKTRNLEVERDKIRADLDVLRARNTPTIVGVGTVQVWRYVREAAARVGLDRDADGDERRVSPHWLRHAAASVASEKGVPPPLLMEYLGHSSLTMTSRYTHATKGVGLSKYL